MWTCHSAEQERSGGGCEHSITHRRYEEEPAVANKMDWSMQKPQS